MTIGISTFYTINALFAIDLFGFFQLFFEFIVNFALFLCFFNKFFIFLPCKKRLCNFFCHKDFLGECHIFSLFNLLIIPKQFDFSGLNRKNAPFLFGQKAIIKMPCRNAHFLCNLHFLRHIYVVPITAYYIRAVIFIGRQIDKYMKNIKKITVFNQNYDIFF
jgi:hypothetical protein